MKPTVAPTSPKTTDSSREWAAIVLVTMAGGLIRLSGVGRSGMTHFDEGIYASAGGWVFQAAGLDPGVIPYAPPVYVLLVGLAYLVLGASDIAAILVSTVTGTLTIPAVAWLARRRFGPGAGAASAVLAALALPHVVFSRMALTDATFLLTWVLGLAAGMLFVERPTLLRGIVLGIAVGTAQLTKYNGWLTGGIVAASAVWDLAVDPSRRDRKSLARTFGFGAVAAVVAALVYAPWFLFVERHGGYSDLLRHQKSYLGGFADWPRHLATQSMQQAGLGGNFGWALASLAAAAGAAAFVKPRRWDSAFWGVTGVVLIGAAFVMTSVSDWILTLSLLPLLLRHSSPGDRFLALAWLIPAILTPFYHPYARLWLPLSAIGWVVLGGTLATLKRGDGLGDSVKPRRFARVTVLAGILGFSGISSIRWDGDPLAPTDSLRVATRALASAIPPEARLVQVLARPPVNFYLLGKTPVVRKPDLDSLAPNEWTVIDEVQALQEPGGREKLDALLARRSVVRVETNRLGPATLLDIDPASAFQGTHVSSKQLWLLRP